MGTASTSSPQIYTLTCVSLPPTPTCRDQGLRLALEPSPLLLHICSPRYRFRSQNTGKMSSFLCKQNEIKGLLQPCGPPPMVRSPLSSLHSGPLLPATPTSPSSPPSLAPTFTTPGWLPAGSAISTHEPSAFSVPASSDLHAALHLLAVRLTPSIPRASALHTLPVASNLAGCSPCFPSSTGPPKPLSLATPGLILGPVLTVILGELISPTAPSTTSVPTITTSVALVYTAHLDSRIAPSTACWPSLSGCHSRTSRVPCSLPETTRPLVLPVSENAVIHRAAQARACSSPWMALAMSCQLYCARFRLRWYLDWTTTTASLLLFLSPHPSSPLGAE